MPFVAGPGAPERVHVLAKRHNTGRLELSKILALVALLLLPVTTGVVFALIGATWPYNLLLAAIWFLLMVALYCTLHAALIHAAGSMLERLLTEPYLISMSGSVYTALRDRVGDSWYSDAMNWAQTDGFARLADVARAEGLYELSHSDVNWDNLQLALSRLVSAYNQRIMSD